MPKDTEPFLIAADAVVPMDPALPKVLLNAGVVVQDGRILALGELVDLRREYGTLPKGKQLRGALLPGFVNTHTHLELSYQNRDRLDPTLFTKWVSSLIASYPPADQLEPIVRKAFRDGIAESLRAGVTTIGDISRHCAITRDEFLKIPPAAAPRLVSFGEVVGLGKMRDRLPGFLDAALAHTSRSDASQSETENQKSKITIAVSPHAPYTVEGPALRKIISRAIARNAPVAMHLAEVAEEEIFLRNLSGALGRDWDLMQKMDVLDDQIPLFPLGGKGTGGPIRWGQRWGLIVTDKYHKDPPPRRLPVILAHVNYCDGAEFAQLAASAISVAYCPRTHAYFNHPPHRYRDMLAAGMNVCLGTDSRASNPDLSILKEAQLLHTRDQLDAYAALALITYNGARALGMSDRVGAIAPAKLADLLFFPSTATDPEAMLKEIVTAAPAPAKIWMDGQSIALSEL